MRRICSIILSITTALTVFGTTTGAQAATTTHQEPIRVVYSYEHGAHEAVAAVHRHHRHHRHVPPRLIAYRWAIEQAGKAYVWGGTGPYGYDCSGLVVMAYRRAGIHLPRTTFDMLSSPLLIEVSPDRALKGDLAFYGAGHVELFVNDRVTFGALNPEMGVGWHRISAWWFPDMFFRIFIRHIHHRHRR